MMREWMAYALVIGAIVAVAALCVEALLRASGKPVRAVWAAALGVTLALVATAPARRVTDATLAAPSPEVSATVTIVAAPHTSAGSLARALIAAAGRPLGNAVRLAAHLPAWLDRWMLLAWATSAAVVFLVLAGAYARWRRATRRWPSTELGGVRVRVAPDAGPAAVGVFAPEVVVPRWLLTAVPEQQRLAVAHELEHLRARDPLLLIACFVPAVLLPWHPAVWWMLSRLRLAVELDCDARVLRRRAGDARVYGTALIDLAQRCSSTMIGAPALAEGPTHLERRLVAMTTTYSRSRRARAGALTLIALVGLAAACETHLPTQAEVNGMDARGAERALLGTRVVDSVTAFTVDGNLVSRDSAMRLKPGDIATVEVRKKDGAIVSIRTRRRAGAAETGLARTSAEKKFAGLIVIDGKRSDQAALSALKPGDIATVEVLKGAAAQAAYPQPEAVNGVIVVNTVKAASTEKR